MSALVFALPSKGRLKEQAEAFFADCGLVLTQVSGARGYAAQIAGLPEVEVRLLSSAEIAQALRDGAAHAGVAGEDLLRDSDPSLSAIALVRPLGFGPADLVVAAPQSWVDVATMADLDEVCHALRARTGARLRVATKYMALTRAFFDAHGMDDYRIVESQGATEGAPAAGAAEVIVDITTTGATLAANHLKPLKDGLILKSEAQVAASLGAAWSDAAHAAFAFILDAIEARLAAKAVRLLRVSVKPGEAGALCAAAEALRLRPSGAAKGDVLEFQCAAAEAPRLAAALMAKGAAGIVVTAPDYVFERPNPAYRRFCDALANNA
jgi:ATP phosphoribosyltransferase